MIQKRHDASLRSQHTTATYAWGRNIGDGSRSRGVVGAAFPSAVVGVVQCSYQVPCRIILVSVKVENAWVHSGSTRVVASRASGGGSKILDKGTRRLEGPAAMAESNSKNTRRLPPPPHYARQCCPRCQWQSQKPSSVTQIYMVSKQGKALPNTIDRNKVVIAGDGSVSQSATRGWKLKNPRSRSVNKRSWIYSFRGVVFLIPPPEIGGFSQCLIAGRDIRNSILDDISNTNRNLSNTNQTQSTDTQKKKMECLVEKKALINRIQSWNPKSMSEKIHNTHYCSQAWFGDTIIPHQQKKDRETESDSLK